MPPRTGTTTFAALLINWGAMRGQGKHIKPSDVNLEDFDTYVKYGFFRNPLDRFLSLLRHMQQTYSAQENITTALNMTPEQIQALSYDQLIDLFPFYEKISSFYYSPQVDWLANANLLDHSCYHESILRVARMFDIKKLQIGTLNATVNSGVQPSQKVIDFVQSYYADDYRLGRERGLLT